MTVRIKKQWIFMVFCGLLSLGSFAQSGLLKTADHHYENLSYIKAIDAYEQALKKKGLTDAEKTSAKIKLADSYSKVKDAQNAERVYAEIANSGTELSAENAGIYLKYAQALASNGKYKESQEQYEKYTAKMDSDPRGKGFSKLYSDVSVLSKNASCYKVDYLSINTNAADFSPANYRSGLVFVSNRQNAGGIKRVFTWNNTPFLDLYHLEDVAMLSGSDAGLGGGSSSKSSKKSKSSGGVVGSDEYTEPTANDSRTLGSFAGGSNSGIGGGGFSDKPITASEKLNGVNSKYHEGPAAFFKDGSKVIFTRNNFMNGVARKSSDGINKLKLYIATANKDSWSGIAELPFNSNEYSTGHPALSPDEKLLFFASDMPGGFGGTDIYVSRYDGTNWSQPINLGKDVNTKGNEMFPFIDEKSNLYFASDGHPGLGELDIFFTHLDGVTQKGRVINIGAPLNSSKDDFGIVTDGVRQKGYFSSNRKRGGNDDDIYKFERDCELKEGCELLIAVYDAESKMPLDNTKITYTDPDGNNLEAITDAEGNVKIDNIDTNHDYAFKAVREGYSPNTVSFSIDECDNEASRLEIPMSIPKQAVDSLMSSVDRSKFTAGPNPLGGKTCIIRGKVLTQNSKNGLSGVEVTLVNQCDNSTQKVMTDKNGFFEFTAVEGCDYVIDGKKDNMGSKSTKLAKLNCNNGPVNTDLLMFVTGDVVEIENIYFDYGRYNIRSDARAGLDKLVRIMRQYPKMRVELRAHTDSRSPADFNQTLSENRAKATAEYLFKRGISKTRIAGIVGYGESMLVNNCSDGVPCSEAEHQKNRRTEIKILQME
jgi:outer membrane protein OmpA-like peptidoglycan-associated protein